MTRSISKAILKLLRPLVRLLLQHGVSYGEFIELAKQSFVHTADHDYPHATRKQSVSRIAMMTGITRKEVSRLRDTRDEESLAEERNLLSPEPYNRGVRIISGWNRDKRFQNKQGVKPILQFEGSPDSFSELVKMYSGDIPARAALDELVRVGAVTILESGDVSLNDEAAYIPDRDHDAKIEILGNSVADLLGTLEHNLKARSGNTRLQLTTAYNNLPRSAIDNFQQLSRIGSRELLKKLDLWLGQHDRDSNNEIDESDEGRMRLGIGIYYIEEDMTRESQI